MSALYRSLIFSAILAFPSPCLANYYKSGNELLRDCTGAAGDQSVCFGYLMGVNDFWGDTGSFCIPVGVEAGQMRDVVVLYLQANPQKRELIAAGLAHLAFREAWPCPKVAPKK